MLIGGERRHSARGAGPRGRASASRATLTSLGRSPSRAARGSKWGIGPAGRSRETTARRKCPGGPRAATRKWSLLGVGPVEQPGGVTPPPVSHPPLPRHTHPSVTHPRVSSPPPQEKSTFKLWLKRVLFLSDFQVPNRLVLT